MAILSNDTIAIMPPTTRNFMFFFKKIRVLLRKEKWNRHCDQEEFVVKFSTKNFGFDYDANELVKKAYRLIGWDARMSYFCTNPDKKGYDYIWEVKKLK